MKDGLIPYQPYWGFSYTHCGSDAALQHYNALFSFEIKKNISVHSMQSCQTVEEGKEGGISQDS